MMKQIIYATIEHCPHCNLDIPIHLLSDDPDFLIKAPNLKSEVKSQAMNEHWFNNHRVCAKCGELIKAGEGSWAFADKVEWPINKTYISWTHKNGLEILDIHKKCSKNSYQVR